WRFPFSLSCQGFSNERAALRAAYDDARAFAPVIGRSCPVALQKGDPSEVVEVRTDTEMVGAERLLVDCERALQQRLGLGIVALLLRRQGEAVEDCTDAQMVGAERLLLDRERALGERLGIGIAALIAIELSEAAERLANTAVLGAERLLRDRERALRQK